MISPNVPPIFGIVMLSLGCIFTIIAMATDSWGKLEPTVTSEFYNLRETLSGHWGLFKVCLKKVSDRQGTQEQCKSLEKYPEYWNAAMAFEILAVICSFMAIPLWTLWVFWKKPPGEVDFPWMKIVKIVAVTFICLTAFWHAVAVAVWNAKDEGPPEVRRFAVSSGFSWGFAIFCIVWELLAMVPIQFSLPYYKRHVLMQRPTTHPLFRPDVEGGGMFGPGSGKEQHPMFSGIEVDPRDPRFKGRRPNVDPGPSTFLNSIPEERNVYKYDPEAGAIVPQTVSRSAGKQTARMLGQTWGRQDSPFHPAVPAGATTQLPQDTPPKQEKSRLQRLKETWSKREGFKFGFGKSNADDSDEPPGSGSNITGKQTKQRKSAGQKIDNSAPLFVKSLWNTHFSKDQIDDNYQVESDTRISENWIHAVEENKRRNFNDSEEEEGQEEEEDDEENGEEVESDEAGKDDYHGASISEVEIDGERVVNVHHPIINNKYDEDDDYNQGSEDAQATYENLPEDTPGSSNFSFKKKSVERKNYNDPSDDEEEDEEGDMDNYLGPDIQIKSSKRQAPGITVHLQTHSRTLDDSSSYETGFDPPQSSISLGLRPGESDDALEESEWRKSIESTGKLGQNNFAYLSDMTEDENITEI